MSKLNIAPGLVVSIPCNDHYVVAKVLYVSRRVLKNIALYKVYDCRVPLDKPYTDAISKGSFNLIYTGISLIKKGEWGVLGNLPLLSSEMKSSKRIIAGDVWVADECLGRATDKELSNIPEMLVSNVKGVERKVAEYPILVNSD